MKNNNKLEKYGVITKKETFYYFDKDVSAEDMAEYLTENGFDAEVVDEDTVSFTVLDNFDDTCEIYFWREEYWSPSYDFENCYTEEEINKFFTITEPTDDAKMLFYIGQDNSSVIKTEDQQEFFKHLKSIISNAKAEGHNIFEVTVKASTDPSIEL